MQFYEAHYLKFLFFLPLLLVLGWLSAGLRRRRLLKLGYEPLVTTKLMPGYRRAEAGIRIFLLLLVFTCLVLALARPQWGESSKKVERKGVDILFLLDTSLSMLSEDIKPNRFAAAKQQIKSIIRKLKGDRVGLVVFSGSAYLQTPLTLDYSAFMLFLESVKVGHIPDPGSSLSSALNYVLRIFPKEDLKYKVLILMTEGEDTFGGLEESITALKDAHIRVYAIGMGTTEGGPIPLKDQTGRQVGFKKDRAGNVVISRMDPDALKKIAAATEGIFLPSTTAGREVDLLLKHISSLGQRNINEKMISEKEDHYGFFLFWAFIFLVLEMFVRRSQRIKPAIMMCAALFLFSGFMETPRGLNKQGNEEFAQKKYQSAIADYQKAKVKAPDDGAIRYNLGTALYQTNQYKDARQEFQKAVALSKQDPDLQAKSYYNLGNAEYRLGNFEGAIKNYKEALKLNPKDGDAKSNLEFVQKQKSLFDKKNDERKKDSPQQNQQQDKQNQNEQNQQQNQNQQQQDQQQQNQDQQQQNQDQQQQNQNQQQQNQDQQQQDQNQQQKQDQQNQDQSQQSQSQQNQEGGQGEGSGQQQQDQNNEPQDSKGQQQNDQKPSGAQGEQSKPDQEQSQSDSAKSEEQKKQEQAGKEGEKSPEQEPKPADQGQNESKAQEQKQDQAGEQGEKSPSEEKEPSEESGQSEKNEDQPQEEQQPEQGEQSQGDEPAPDQNEDQPGGQQGLEEQNQDIAPPDDLSQVQGEENKPAEGEEEGAQNSAEKGQEKGNAGGSGTQYQGQMSMDSALKILEALHEGEKDFSDLRRPPAHRKQVSVEKDW